MSIPLQMASDSFIQVDRISRYRSHPLAEDPASECHS